MDNVSVLCEETLWPLATGFVDRLVMMHGLETSENPAAVLDEAHRVPVSYTHLDVYKRQEVGK